MSELTAKENIKTADTVKRITATAVMAALTTLMTAYIFHIPVGVNGGYVHLGDTMIYLAAAFLPLPYACAAGAIGGGLADLLTAPVWAPATIIIKMLICLPFSSKGTKLVTKRNVVALFLAFAISATGYYIAEGIMFGFTASSLAAAVASLGVTAGLALQGSLSNFAGGLLILVLHPFRVGDYIIEDTHKNEGTVIEISVFYTKLRTIDNKIIVIPNGTLANTSLTNATKSDRRQMDLVVPIGYDADIKKAKDILMELVEAENRRLPEDVNVFVKELGASSVDLGLRFWVPTDQYWPVRWQLLEDIKIRFDAEKISIPFQQVDVNIKQ